ncbi:MAG: NAD-dependent epimerase/dehydratase family protein [Spirochaetaceae bacterium]|jgi:dihydroflavonol-4-reductase|nr:NAD-dependent epimerase/dehydratase family protein [Spirochaetaceae bacterium]
MNKDIHVVTGANGRTGFALCAELKARGCFVRALLRTSAEWYRPFLEPYVDEFVTGDIRERVSLDAAFSGACCVYHLAGIVSIASAMTAELEDVNVQGVKNVIDACLAHRVPRLVHTGTVHTLPFHDTTSILREIPRYMPDAVQGPYARTKAIASNLVLDAVTERGLNAVIAMPSGIIGGFELKRSNLGAMVVDVAEGRLPVYLKGEYDFVDVRDVARAIADLATMGPAGESYILSGHKTSVKELISYAAEAAGRKPPSLCLPRPLVQAFSYPAEMWALLCGATLVFTPYAIKVLGDNCNFSHEKISMLTGYTPASVQQAVAEQVKFYFDVYKPMLNGKRL